MKQQQQQAVVQCTTNLASSRALSTLGVATQFYVNACFVIVM